MCEGDQTFASLRISITHKCIRMRAIWVSHGFNVSPICATDALSAVYTFNLFEMHICIRAPSSIFGSFEPTIRHGGWS